MDSIKQAIEWMENGNVEQALDVLTSTIHSASDEDIFLISEIYEEWGFIEEAVSVLDDLLKKYPGEGQLLTKLAELNIELDNDERALNLLHHVTKTDEFYLSALLLMADLYEVQGLFEVSEQKLLAARKIAKDDDVYIIDFALAELMYSTGQSARAITFYEKVLTFANEINNISVKERLAESYALLGNYEQALQMYEVVNSEQPDLLFKYGFTAFHANKNELAIALWERLVEIDPDYNPVYYELASVYQKEGLHKEAYRIAKEGLLHDEFDKRLYFMAGKMALQLDEKDTAIHLLEKAVGLDDDYKEAILLLIDAYKMEDRHEKIIDFISTMKSSGVNDPFYNWELARAYYEMESFDLAKSSYEEAANHLQHNSEFLSEYGYFLVEEGLISESLTVFNNYLTLETEDEETQRFVERLRFSKNDEI